MDRRQRKSREAIFEAFTQLLSEKDYTKITVGEIIERADVGRATFYAHFETKDFLLRELNRELFCHIFDADTGNHHKHIFECDAPDSVFLHLLQHISRNDNHILKLISYRKNDLFWGYFIIELTSMIESRYEFLSAGKAPGLPKDYWIHHAAATFVNTLRWWLSNGKMETPEQIYNYFMLALNMDDMSASNG